MKFVVIDDSFSLDRSPWLSEAKKVSSSSDVEGVYEISDDYRSKMKVLEEFGFVKEIKGEITELEQLSDLMRLTDKVELLQGGDIYLKVKLVNGHEFLFSEDEMLGLKAIKQRLLRLKAVIPVTGADWREVLKYWLSIAEEINEPSEERSIAERVLDYLSTCIVYKEKEKVVSPYSLFYDEATPNSVFCSIDELVERLGYQNRRKLRSILSDYIVDSARVRVHGRRYRFWLFSVERCEIDLDKQMEKVERRRDNEVREEAD